MGKSTQNQLLIVSYTERSQITRLLVQEQQLVRNVKYMNQKYNSEFEDELRDEYDFNSLPVVARGPGRKHPNKVTIELEPDVAEIFSDSVAVNEALRFSIKITQKSISQLQ